MTTPAKRNNKKAQRRNPSSSASASGRRAAPTARRAGPSIKRRSRKRPASTAASVIGSTLFVVLTYTRNKSTRGVAGKWSVAC